MSSDKNTFTDVLSEALERLKNGTWKEWVQEALDSLIAREQNAKWILFYSGLSAWLPDKLHIFIMGKSQHGKSFLQTRVGTLFEDNFKDISEMSSKALYYEGKEKKNPDLYRNKIVFLDEFKDLPDSTKAFIKKMTSGGRENLTLKTVIDQKYEEFEISAIPVIWTNSMEKIKDEGDQILNRFFPLNVDEGLAQSKTVEEYQIKRETYGILFEEKEQIALERVRAVIYHITREHNFIVVNPFAGFIRLKDHSRRNMRPKFFSLLSAITYANRFNRPCYEEGGKKFLMASLSDNLEALQLWKDNEGYICYSLPERYLKLLEVFSEGDWLSKMEIAEGYREQHGEAITEDTAGTYAYELEKKGTLISRYREGERYKEYSRSNMSNISVLELQEFSIENLASVIDPYFEAGLISNTESKDIGENVQNFVFSRDDLLKKLLDAPFPSSSNHKTLDSVDDGSCTEKKLSQEDKKKYLDGLLPTGQSLESLEEYEEECPGITDFAKGLLSRGLLVQDPRGILYSK